MTDTDNVKSLELFEKKGYTIINRINLCRDKESTSKKERNLLFWCAFFFYIKI